jgi:hypothetical protein
MLSNWLDLELAKFLMWLVHCDFVLNFATETHSFLSMGIMLKK